MTEKKEMLFSYKNVFDDVLDIKIFKRNEHKENTIFSILQKGYKSYFSLKSTKNASSLYV